MGVTTTRGRQAVICIWLSVVGLSYKHIPTYRIVPVVGTRVVIMYRYRYVRIPLGAYYLVITYRYRNQSCWIPHLFYWKALYIKKTTYRCETYFEWSRVRLTLGASGRTHSSVVERSIADHYFSFYNTHYSFTPSLFIIQYTGQR